MNNIVNKFNDFLFRASEKFDKEIAQSATYSYDYRPLPPAWWTCRESVRKISEGIHYTESLYKFSESDCPIGSVWRGATSS